MNIYRLLLVGSVVCFAQAGFAISDDYSKLKNKKAARAAAECAPATTVDYLEFNNVNALIETGGSMWQDRPNGASAYEVPNGSGKTAIYSGSLWMGGTDINDQLKIAAVTFRQGRNDFWTGPLTTDGSAEIQPDVCQEYDKFFHITRQEVVDFIDWWNCNVKDPALRDPSCADRDFTGYKIPKVITDWPAHGDQTRDQDEFLAPFFDNGDEPNGEYNPEEDGDYPYYDLNGDVDCRAVRDIRLFGDDTYWWVFNDKGNIHTETNGQSIGMEIRAQAFAFATNDEVNDMTFYNYELINRSTFTLFNTYFGQWVDADVGCANDDYVGCDVGRGLGYAYNGDQNDEDCNGANGYGNLPAAIGVDFFEGPYQDNDSINNLKGIGPGEALNGIGYLDLNLPRKQQDSIVDNERYGMRRFVYYNRGLDGRPQTDAITALHHYNYLRSIWKDGAKMVFGGNGHPNNPGASTIQADFMFPGTSDPLNWGTRGVDPGNLWTEVTAGNPPFDRRFIQSAGPFTLTPGAVNDITVGVVFAQAASGNNEASVQKMITADTKAQALFDNCFDVLDGPDAPDLNGVELNKELVLFLTNKRGVSNNYKNYPGDYEEKDPFIVTPEGVSPPYDDEYRFQGYLIYQVYDESVSVSDLENLDKARLAFQCDVKDDVADLINYNYSEELDATVPQQMVKDAANNGIVTTFRVTNDLFAEEDPRLVNFKTYYFIAIAYAYNNFKEYSETLEGLDGQKLPFLSSRKSTTGAITSVAFMPHPQEPKNGGMKLNAGYGDQPDITRVEGQGNGGNVLAFTPQTLIDLMANSDNPGMNQPTYVGGNAPITVKVVDPTNVSDGKYVLQSYYYAKNNQVTDTLMWKAWRLGEGEEGLNDTVYSETDVSIENEQIISKWGVSVSMNDVLDPNVLIRQSDPPDPSYDNGYITATIEYIDSSRTWLTGISDVSGVAVKNWIRSGTADETADPEDATQSHLWNSYFTSAKADPPRWAYDPFSLYEGMLDGTWAPWRMVAFNQTSTGPNGPVSVVHTPAAGILAGTDVTQSRLEDLQSVSIVFTSDQTLWTRCPVIEIQDDAALAEGNGEKGFMRISPSVDKDGKPDGTGDGMGWFPGYAINLETGERLNMAFGEDSWLGDNNGTDMMWNPTDAEEGGWVQDNPADTPEREVVWGGKHFVYVFGNTDYYNNYNPGSQGVTMPSYDEGKTLSSYLQPGGSQPVAAKAWSTCMWAGIPMLEEGADWENRSDVTISFHVTKPYEVYKSDSLQNNGLPMYRWDMETLKTNKNVNSIAENALSMIKVVPNPYYAFAEHYEQDQLDNKVKITNLPERCTVSIYNVGGTLIRKFNKTDPSTEIVWDLVNQSEVPIAGGLYLIHVDAPGIGETIVKWFGVLRPIDLQGF